jgi:hypothetical protein
MRCPTCGYYHTDRERDPTSGGFEGDAGWVSNCVGCFVLVAIPLPAFFGIVAMVDFGKAAHPNFAAVV